MNIERLKKLVLGIVDNDDVIEAQKILSDSKSYGDLQLQVATLMNQLADAKQESVSLKKQLEEEKHDHAGMENALARARLRAEGERDQAQLAAKVIEEEEFLRRARMRWNGKKVLDDCLNPLGKMIEGLRQRAELAEQKRGKPESQIQAELLADMHRCNVIRAGSFSDVKMMQDAIRNAINRAAHSWKVFNQMNAILEKK